MNLQVVQIRQHFQSIDQVFRTPSFTTTRHLYSCRSNSPSILYFGDRLHRSTTYNSRSSTYKSFHRHETPIKYLEQINDVKANSKSPPALKKVKCSSLISLLQQAINTNRSDKKSNVIEHQAQSAFFDQKLTGTEKQINDVLQTIRIKPKIQNHIPITQKELTQSQQLPISESLNLSQQMNKSDQQVQQEQEPEQKQINLYHEDQDLRRSQERVLMNKDSFHRALDKIAQNKTQSRLRDMYKVISQQNSAPPKNQNQDSSQKQQSSQSSQKSRVHVIHYSRIVLDKKKNKESKSSSQVSSPSNKFKTKNVKISTTKKQSQKKPAIEKEEDNVKVINLVPQFSKFF